MYVRLLYEIFIALAIMAVAWKLILKPIGQLLGGVKKSLPTPVKTAKQRLDESQKELDDAKLRLEAAHLDDSRVRLEKQTNKVQDETLRNLSDL